MINTEMTKKACNIMYREHMFDLDKAGFPFVFHPWHVAESMPDEKSACAALLHDLIEKHRDKWGIGRLRDEGFPEDVLKAVFFLTHNPETPYMDYIRALSKDPIAKMVKIADLKHNMDETRLTRDENPKWEQYKEALEYLEKQ